MSHINETTKNIHTDHKENIGKIIQDFLSDIAKQEMLKKLPQDEIVCLWNAMRVTSSVPPSFLEYESKSNNFKYVYDLLQKSIASNIIIDELSSIYDARIQNFFRILKYKQLKMIPSILGDQQKNYKNLKKKNKEKAKRLFENQFSKASESVKKKYKCLDPEHQKKFLIKLNIDLLKTKIVDDDFLNYIAFLILFPEHQILEFNIYFDDWNNFSLKWYFQSIPINVSKDVFLHYREDKSFLDNFFPQIYANNDFSKINSFCDSPYLNPPVMHILCKRRAIVNEILSCYKENYFTAVVCTALPIIEGILWEFSFFVHQQEGNIYSEIDSRKIGIDCIRDKYTVGSIIKKTRFKEKLDTYFIDYFCDELYNERNPILHGTITASCFSQINAAKKIATIEYLLDTINNYSKYIIKEHFKKTIPAEVQNRLKEKLKTL